MKRRLKKVLNGENSCLTFGHFIEITILILFTTEASGILQLIGRRLLKTQYFCIYRVKR